MLTRYGHRPDVAALAAAIVYVALVAVGVFATAGRTHIPVIVPAAGALVALLVLSAPRRWPLLIAFAFVVPIALRAAAGGDVVVGAGLSVTHCLAALAVAAVARRLDPGAGGREHDARSVLALLGGLAVVGSVALALLALSLPVDPVPSGLLAHAIVGWTLGALIVAPPFLAIGRLEGSAPARRSETVGALAILAVVCVPVFLRPAASGGVLDTIGYTFLVFPPLLWLALRARTVAVNFALLGVALVAIAGTGAGRGSFARASLDADERLVALQLFLAVATTCVLLVGTVGRRRLADAQRLGESEELYRLMAGALPGLAVALFDLDLRCVVAHTEQLAAAGARTSIVGRHVDELYVHEHEAGMKQALQRALAGETVVIPWAMTGADGLERRLEVRAAPHRDGRGVIVGAMAVGIDVTARAATEDRLRFLADRDPLTGLLNRRAFELALGAHAGGDGSLVLIDLDDFKGVNDANGHAVGDAVLIAVADALGARLRRDDPVGRLGGDEFAVLLPRAHGAAGERIAAELVEAVRARTAADPDLPTVTVSAGASDLAGRSAEDAYATADAAMYAAKRAGRDRLVTSRG